jgi:hypothetical protein
MTDLLVNAPLRKQGLALQSTFAALFRAVRRDFGLLMLASLCSEAARQMMELAAGGGSPGPSVLTMAVCLELVALVAGWVVTFIIARRGLGLTTTAEEAASALLRRLPALIALTMLCGIAVLLGSIALVIPGILIALNLTVAAPVCMLEECSALKSMSRSTAMVSGSRWTILGIIVTIGMALLIPMALEITTANSLSGLSHALVLSTRALFHVPLIALAGVVYAELRASELASTPR